MRRYGFGGGERRPLRRAAWARCALLPALVAGCADATGPPHPLLEETAFAPELGVDLARMDRTGGGVYVQDLQVGHGAVLDVPRKVRIDYALYVPDGRHVQTRGEVDFILGCRQVVSGLETGVRGMQVGGRRLVVVPPRMGYGSQPPWGVDVPPHSILVFVVDAVSSAPAPEAMCRARL